MKAPIEIAGIQIEDRPIVCRCCLRVNRKEFAVVIVHEDGTKNEMPSHYDTYDQAQDFAMNQYDLGAYRYTEYALMYSSSCNVWEVVKR